MSRVPLEDMPKFSKLACTSPACGIKHKLDEFPIGSWVFVKNPDNKFFTWKGKVAEWSQYNCPVYYRVEFGVNRENFDPCELRACADPSAQPQPTGTPA